MFTYFRNKNGLFLLTLILTALFALAGCGAEKQKTEETSTSKEEESYTIKHSMGETTIQGTPKKIVVLSNEGTEALLSMGVTPIAAVQSWTGDPWYDHISDKMIDVKVVGTESEVNVEAIAALKPDLILGVKMRQEKIYDQLNAIAPTVFAETLRGDWKENFQLWSKAINKEEKGKEVLAAYDQRIEDIKGKLGDKVNSEVSVVRFIPGVTRILYTDSFSGVIFDQIGFKRPTAIQELFADNPEDQFMREVGKELIPKMDGDILFYFTYETGDNQGTKVEEEWTNDSLWKNLSVVKEGKAFKVDDNIWNTAGGVIAADLMLNDVEKFFLEQ